MDALAVTPGTGGACAVGQTRRAVVRGLTKSDRRARCSQPKVWHAVAERRMPGAGPPQGVRVCSLGARATDPYLVSADGTRRWRVAQRAISGVVDRQDSREGCNRCY
jgi:hypothetical protein